MGKEHKFTEKYKWPLNIWKDAQLHEYTIFLTDQSKILKTHGF